MAEEKISPRIAWYAGLLQVGNHGLGHVYCGRPLRGLVFFMLSVAVSSVALLGFIVLPATLNLIVPVVIELALISCLVFDAVHCAKSASSEYRLRRYNRWYFYIAIWIGATFFGVMYARFMTANVEQAFRITSESMSPTFVEGDHVLTNMAVYRFRQPARGDLVAFGMPNQLQTRLVKRIVALPGETIEIRNGSVFIDGTLLHETYTLAGGLRIDDPTLHFLAPTKIPDGTYFLMGDNRGNSLDSRYFGPVPKDRILGVVRMVYLSIEPESDAIRWNRFGLTPE